MDKHQHPGQTLAPLGPADAPGSAAARGFYIARAKGWYADAGLEVDIVSPHVDEYASTPASRLAAGTAAFAIVPSERWAPRTSDLPTCQPAA